MQNQCAVCGRDIKGGIALGGVIMCRTCEPDVTVEIERLREAGKPVNVGHIARKLYRERVDTSSYLLRDLPDELLMLIKQRALADDCTQRDVILAAIRQYVGM